MRINGQAMRAIRERSEIRLTDLAEAVGVYPGTLSNIEAGRRTTSWKMAKAIARELRVPVTAIAAAEDDQKAAS